MDKKEYFEEENVAEVIHHPAATETLEQNLLSSNTKTDDIRKRKNFEELMKNEEPAMKISNTTTNYNFSAPDENSHEECFINRLPTDLLSRIIELTPIKLWPKIESISRHFQAATFSSWRNLREVDFAVIDNEFSLRYGNRKKGKLKLQLLLQKLNVRSPLISSIFGCDKYVNDFDESIIISAASFSRLHTMEFANVNFSPELFHLFFATLKNLDLLANLHLVHTICVQEGDETKRMDIEQCLTQIFRDIPLQLQGFSYENNFGCGSEFLEFIDATKLKDLSLDGSQLNSAHVTNLFSRCTELRFLYVNRLSLSGTQNLQYKLLLQAIASNCLKLETLEAEGSCLENVDDLRAIFKDFSRFTNLRRFSLSHLIGWPRCVPCEVFTAVTTHCRNLTQLHIATELDVENPEFFSPLSRMEDLQSLQLSMPMNGSTMRTVIRYLHDLRNLHTLGFKEVPNDDDELFSLCSLEQLQKLTVCEGVKNRTLRCWTYYGLINRLKVLELIRCMKISDLGMRYIANYGSEKLESLRLTESAVTVVGVRAVLTAFKRLRELDVRGCNHVKRSELKDVAKQFGVVKIQG